MKFYLFFWIVFINFSLVAQVVTTVPGIPSIEDEITVRFYAEEGTGGLADYTGDVYAHTGVLTEESGSNTDWKYVKTNWGENTEETKLTRISDNIYEIVIGPDAYAYYGVPSSETITAITFVFRSDVPVNGSYLEGKDDGGQDIIIELAQSSDDFIVQRVRPNNENLIVSFGTSFEYQANASQAANFELLDNGIRIGEATGTNVFNLEITASERGNHDLILNASTDAGMTFSDTIRYIVPFEQITEDLNEDYTLGASIFNDSVRFVLEAPGKENVFLISSLTSGQLDAEVGQLKKSSNGDYFWIDVPLNGAEEITYQYIVDDIQIADPLSYAILDPRDDQFLPMTIQEKLPPYPAFGEGNVSWLKTNLFEYEFQHQAPEIANGDLVIYELLIRDFDPRHTYQSVIDRIDYFKDLGVNVIELMPVNEFEGNISWGYNPSFHGAIDKYYGTPEDFKRFVDIMHENGMLVIIDVVYNHAFSQSPLCQLYWDDAAFRPTDENPWLNTEARHPFNVGYDFNHESEYTQRYVKQTLKRLIEEFRVDGFRFDLSKGFTQRFSTDVGAWNAYDANRMTRLKDYADFIWSIDPTNKITFEHLGINTEEEELSDYGIMLWSKMTEPYNEATMGFNDNRKSDLSGTYYQDHGWQFPHLISYMESHDEERLMVKNIQFGNSDGSYNVRNIPTGLDRVEAATAIFYAIPGAKMLWQFGELGYDFSINYCLNNGNIDESCRTGEKPIRWDYLQNDDRFDLFRVTSDMIYLKNQLGLFPADATVDMALENAVKYLQVNDAVVMANFDVISNGATWTFPTNGKWYDYFSGDSIELGGRIYNTSLEPGEYRLYLKSKIDRYSDDLTTSSEDLPVDFSIEFYPNPVQSSARIEFYGPLAQEEKEILIVNIAGQVLHRHQLSEVENQRDLDLSNLTNGTYFVLINGENHISRFHFIKQ